MKRCDQCGHSEAAHVDGLRCALCGCAPARRTFVQESFTFKTSIQKRATANTRRR